MNIFSNYFLKCFRCFIILIIKRKTMNKCFQKDENKIGLKEKKKNKNSISYRNNTNSLEFMIG